MKWGGDEGVKWGGDEGVAGEEAEVRLGRH